MVVEKPWKALRDASLRRSVILVQMVHSDKRPNCIPALHVEVDSILKHDLKVFVSLCFKSEGKTGYRIVPVFGRFILRCDSHANTPLKTANLSCRTTVSHLARHYNCGNAPCLPQCLIIWRGKAPPKSITGMTPLSVTHRSR